MDKLERYITENRERFDMANPDPRIWQQIEAQLPRQVNQARVLTLWKVVAAAAVVLVLILSGVIGGLIMGRAPSPQYSEAIEEFRRAESYFNVQLEARYSELEKYAYDQSVETDLNELARVYEELSAELEDGMHPNRDELIQALILNYKTRIDLLEKVLERMDQTRGQMELNESDDENIKI